MTDSDTNPQADTEQEPDTKAADGRATEAGQTTPETAPETAPPVSTAETAPPTGTGAGASDAPRTLIGAQDSAAINASLAALAAGTVRLAP